MKKIRTYFLGSLAAGFLLIQAGCEPTPVPAADLQPQLFFSPNGDGIGDTWAIKGIELHPTYQVQVYDQYGNRVFEAKPYTNQWDGQWEGKALMEGVYSYIIRDDKGKQAKAGSVTLVR